MMVQTGVDKKAARTCLSFSAIAPALFVCLWATGFIGGKLGLPHAEPLTFLLIRFIAALTVLVPLALIFKAPWPADRLMWRHAACSGLLVHGGYLGGVFGAIAQGMPAGVIALIVGLQPLFTALLAAKWMGEQVSGRQWTGLGLGFAGVALVVSGKLGYGGTGAGGMNATSLALALLALASITAGTLYQKRHCQDLHLLSGTAVQYAACLAVYMVLAPLLETMRVDWTGQFIFALAWLVIVLSIVSIMLLYYLIRKGAATQVTSLFYMVPPTTAIMAWLIFDEALAGSALIGMAICALGVALAVRAKPG